MISIHQIWESDLHRDNFCKNQQLKQALLTSVDLLHAGDYDDIRRLIDNALKAGQDKNIGHEYNKDTESRYREEHRIVIPTPWKEFNELFQGGVGNGDFGLIFGNPGGGKSWCLVALGAEAVRLGYNVIHYTLELSEDYVGKRYDACFTGIPVNEITNYCYTQFTEIFNYSCLNIRRHSGECISTLRGGFLTSCACY